VHSQGGNDGLKAKAFARLLQHYPENLVQEPQLFIHFQRRWMQGRRELVGHDVMHGQIFDRRTPALKGFDLGSQA
jgi:hypothetical protein